LENHVEVACKLHQLNVCWTDTVKENYIKHTIRENQIHKEIQHSKVVKHYDTIEIDNSSFCTVLELCSGPDLYTFMKLNKNITEKEARLIIYQILSGLEYLNKLNKKIIHYDLKPQNILFHNTEVKISDFGLAKIMEDNHDKIEQTSIGVGTYWYLPPECFPDYNDKQAPTINSKVDIWSVGVILYEIMYGKRPFGHSMTQERIFKEGVMKNARHVEFPVKPQISEECKVTSP
jgi:tousled-like kinase